MSGILVHARRLYRGESFRGRDGRTHHELDGDDRATDSASNVSWRAMVDYCASRGVPREAWPHYASSIDLDLDDVRSRNVAIRAAIARFPPEDLEADGTLRRVADWIRDGREFFFSETD